MDAPTPVDMNKMAHILRASKAVMQKVESGDVKGGHIDGNQLVQEGLLDTLPNDAAPKGHNLKNAPEHIIRSSKLPENVKRAMIENPIPKTTLAQMNQAFSIDDIPDDLLEKPMPAPQYKPRQRINEGHAQGPVMGINMTENALRGMIKDIVIEVLVDEYSQNLTENAIKKTINMLIKEGKITTRKKVVKS